MRDHDRTLNERGIESAAKLARHFKDHNIRPDVILCSSAQRTRETLAPILASLGKSESDVTYSSSIYEAPDGANWDALCDVEDAKSVLVVGHNPTTEELALTLLGDNQGELLVDIHAGYPTGGLTHLRFADGSWADSLKQGASFVSFVSPRSLPI